MSAPLKVGEVHVGNEENRLSIEINKGLENCYVHSFVRGKQWHFNIRNWKKMGMPQSTAYILTLDTGHTAFSSTFKKLKLHHY